MTGLPDSRRYGANAGTSALARLVDEASRGDVVAKAAVRAQVRQQLVASDDAALRAALSHTPSAAAYRCLWDAICSVAESHEAGTDDAPLVARPFAIPVVLVAGARGALRIPGVVPDIAAVHALLEQYGAVGATRNFGLSAELCPLEVLECISPGNVFRWNNAYTSDAPDGIKGASIEVAPGREQAHLRFVLGAGITPAHLPSFLETAANIGTWGAAFTRELARQLAHDGLTLLPLARPPAGLLRAAQAGRCAVIETAFQLFASQALRTFRMAAGEPVVVVSAHRDSRGAEVRVSMSSMFDDTLLEGFCWPLHPLDDFDDVVSFIADLLQACRVGDVRWIPQVFAYDRAGSAPVFISVRELARTTAAAMRH